MARHIALLRGINLGSHRRVAMADLRELLNGLGYDAVRTHLQSGNVLLSSEASPDQLERRLEHQIGAHLGVATRVIVRSRDELADVVKRNPLRAVAFEAKRYQVSFLSDAPHADVVSELANVDVSPEQFVVSGREIFTWHPYGLQRSPLVRLLSERRLGVAATARNWNTVTKLLELADQ